MNYNIIELQIKLHTDGIGHTCTHNFTPQRLQMTVML